MSKASHRDRQSIVGSFLRRKTNAVGSIVIGVVALALTVHLLSTFLIAPRERWIGLLHDRAGHYDYGLKMAVALENGDVLQFLIELEKGKKWPPLHGVLVAVTQLLTNNDWRAAILPSLLGWLVTLVAVYHTSCKVAVQTRLGWFAGTVAFTFAALSPAGREYATDIMLESLGAALSILVLCTYASATQSPSRAGRWRAVSLLLTLLFFEKYNYWAIVVLALVAANSRTLLMSLQDRTRPFRSREWLKQQLCDALNWLLAGILAVVACIYLRGHATLYLFGQNISFYPPNNLLTIAYWIFFARVAVEVRRTRHRPLSIPASAFWKWHVLPVSISLLFPQRLGALISYLSPAVRPASWVHNAIHRVPWYRQAFVSDYHAGTFFAVLCAVLVCVVVSKYRELNQGARAVLLCGLIGTVVTATHPIQEPRFLHSWMPAVWASAGTGAAMVCSLLPMRVVAAIVAALALACSGWSAWLNEPGRRRPLPPGRSLLDMSDAWLTRINNAQQVAFVSTQPCRAFVDATFLSRFGMSKRLEWPRWQANGDAIACEQWLHSTSADAIVFIEVLPGSPEFLAELEQRFVRLEFPAQLSRQQRFREASRVFTSNGCVVTIWRPQL